MMHAIVALACSASLAAPWVSFQQPRAGGARAVSVYVSVLDSSGKPAPGLSAGDFVVREDGASREVLKAGPATEPIQLVLVVDDSQEATRAISSLREGLNAFVDKMNGKADMALVTIGERPTSVVEHTTDIVALKKGINRIFGRPGAGTYFTEGIVEVSKGLQKRETPRPVILAIVMEGIEYSNTQYQQALDALNKSGAALHVLAIGTPAAGMSDELRNRNQTMAEGTERTGGRRDQLLSEIGLDTRLKQVADDLLNQYVVTYARPETLIPPEKLQVTVTRPGLTVRARTRVPGK
jgi:VWFA-related protein